MKKHAAILCTLMFLVLCITGCTKQEGENSVAGKIYTYSGEPFSGLETDDFTITVNGDGTYSYCESLLSSYIGIGKWSVADDVLTLSDDTGAEIINYFLIDGERFHGAIIDADS